MRDHRAKFYFLLLCISLPLFAQITSIQLAEPTEGAIIACQDQRIIIEIMADSDIDPATVALEVNDSVYTLGLADSNLIWNDPYLEYNPAASEIYPDGRVSVVLHPFMDLSGDESMEQSWEFFVDVTPPQIAMASPMDETVEEIAFDITIELEDPVFSIPEAASGVNHNLTVVTIQAGGEEQVLSYGDPALQFDGTTYTISTDDLDIAFMDNQEIIVFVETCDLSGCVSGPNCANIQFNFGTGESPCYLEPNPITPNGDGINDFAELRYPNMRDASKDRAIHIFDQQSNKVREITSPEGAAWIWNGRDDDGMPMGQGTYLYVVIVDDEVECDGTITVLR